MTEIFQQFQEFRKILCVCPCCSSIVRISDLHLKTKGPYVNTWLDDFDKKHLEFQIKEKRFEEKEGKLRKLAVEKGRIAAEKAINKTLSPALKTLKLDPYDVKAILNPIDFVVFKGMTKKDSINDILLLSKQVVNPDLNKIRQQVKKAVEKKEYGWQVARIDGKGKIVFE